MYAEYLARYQTMENTQLINWDDEEEEETEGSSESSGYTLEPVGRLHVFSSIHGPERDFPLYIGKNVVGRSPECCVSLPFPSISKQHAVIEIATWNKAPVLQDCGSLNGTQIVRPPKVLIPGVSHRLRDQEVILFADFPCQYHRLDAPMPLVSRGPLCIESTPRVQEGTQPSRLMLAEDSEEEVDFLTERHVNGSRITSSPFSTMVPESDEEELAVAPGVSEPSPALNLGSDTDEDDQQPRTETTEAKEPEANGAALNTDTHKGPWPLGKTRPAGFVDSDTDVEEEAIPETPAILPVKEKQVLCGVSAQNPQESPTGSDTDVEEGEAPPAAPLEKSHASMVIHSDTDEDEVSAALTLAHLKENGAAVWNRDTDVEEDRAQAPVLLQQSRSASGRDSDTDVEEEGLPRVGGETVPSGPESRGGALGTAHPEERQPPLRHRDVGEDMDRSFSGVQLEESQASATGDNTPEENASPGPPVAQGEKHQGPVEGTHQTDVEAQGMPLPVEDCQASAVTEVRKRQSVAAGDTNAEGTAAVPEGERALEVGAQGRSLVARVDQVVVDNDTPGEPAQPQREGTQTPTGRGREAHVGGTKSSKVSCCDSEDLCLPATQCFLEEESQSPEGEDISPAVQNLEEEPTQAFPFNLPQEPGSSLSNFQTEGSGGLDIAWEVLATQPFCLKASVISEPQPIATQHEARGLCPSPCGASPQHQHPVQTSPAHSEPLGIQGRKMQTMKKGMGTHRETAERVTPEDGPPDSGEVEGEKKLARGTEDREHHQGLAGAAQRPEPAKVKDRASWTIDTEMTRGTQEKEEDGEVEKSERAQGSPVLDMTLDRTVTEGGSRDQTGPATSPTPEPMVGVEDREGFPSALVVSGSQGDEGKGDPVSPGKQQRGRLTCKVLPSDQASKGDPEFPAPCLLSTVPEVSAPPQSPLPSQHLKPSVPQPLVSPPFPFEAHLSETRHNGTRGVPETLPSSEALHTKPQTRSLRSSRTTPSLLSSAARKHRAAYPSGQPAAPKLATGATRGRTGRSSIRTPEPLVPTDPEPQPSTSADQPVIPKPTSRVTRSKRRSSIKTSEPAVPTGPEPQPPTTEQPVTPKPTSQVSRGRTSRSSVRTPEASAVPTAPEPQPFTSREHPDTPRPTARVTRGRTRTPIETPEPAVPTGPEPQPPTTEQVVISRPTSPVSRGRTSRSSLKTPEPFLSTDHELQPPPSADQPVTSKPTSRDRTRKSSATEAAVSTTPEAQSFISREQANSPRPTARVTRSRTHRSPTETPESGASAAPDLEPPTSTKRAVHSEAARQSRSLSPSTPSASSGPTTSEFQPPVAPPAPILQTSHGRKQRTRGKQGSRTAPDDHKPCSAPPNPESPGTTPESLIPQLSETPDHTHTPQTQNTGRSGLTPKAAQILKRPSTTTVKSPVQKRLRREVAQKTVLPKEEDTAEMVVKEEPQEVEIPVPGKRKRDQVEKEAKGTLNRNNIRRTKSNQETAPKILFTGVVDMRGERAVLALGGSLASSVNEASHLVTDRIRRTVKFLCALGKGLPILSLNWLYQSRKAGFFLPPDDYLVSDPEQEKNFNFSLRGALNRARKRKLLEGYEIYVTSGVQPPPTQMGEIICCCGGTVLPSMPRSYKPGRIIITCAQDLPRCAVPSRLGLPLLSPEFLLTGVLRQEAMPQAFVLSDLEMSFA